MRTLRYNAVASSNQTIDLSDVSVFELSPASTEDIAPSVAPLIIPGEHLVSCFKGVRDFVVFTNKRLIAVNVQG